MDDGIVPFDTIFLTMVGDGLLHDLVIRLPGATLPPGNSAIGRFLNAQEIINVEQLTKSLTVAGQAFFQNLVGKMLLRAAVVRTVIGGDGQPHALINPGE